MSGEGQVLRIDRDASGVRFWIHVSARASHNRVGGLHGDALRVAVTAAPVEGKANAACSRLLAEALGVPRQDVALDPGSKGRRKRVAVAGDSLVLERRLRSLTSLAGREQVR